MSDLPLRGSGSQPAFRPPDAAAKARLEQPVPSISSGSDPGSERRVSPPEDRTAEARQPAWETSQTTKLPGRPRRASRQGLFHEARKAETTGGSTSEGDLAQLDETKLDGSASATSEKEQARQPAAFAASLSDQLLGGSPVAFNNHETLSAEGIGSGPGTIAAGDLIFTRDDIETILSANTASDKPEPAPGATVTKFEEAWRHMTELKSFSQVMQNWSEIQSLHDKVQTASSKEEALKTFGEILHGIQDFYAHSNYVELYREYHAAKHGQPPQPRDYPTFEEGLKDLQFRSLYLEPRLRTAEYDNQRELLSKLPPQYRPADFKVHPFGHESMNKDGPDRPFFEEAAHLARKQTAVELARFRESIDRNPSIRWPRVSDQRIIDSDNFGNRIESWRS